MVVAFAWGYALFKTIDKRIELCLNELVAPDGVESEEGEEGEEGDEIKNNKDSDGLLIKRDDDEIKHRLNKSAKKKKKNR